MANCFPASTLASKTVATAAFPLNLRINLKIDKTKDLIASEEQIKDQFLFDKTVSIIHAKAVINHETHPARTLADFHPGIWGDRFLTLSANPLANENEALAHEKLKEEVRKMIVKAITDPSRNLDLVDTVTRLGVSYHFEEEINEFMQKLGDNLDECVTNNADDLRRISLCFRLLRQQGYRASCEMFSNFIDEEGNLKETLISDDDREGLLNLYEAAHFRVHGEDVLEKALCFSVAKLTSMNQLLDIVSSYLSLKE